MANEKRLIDAYALAAEFMEYADTGIEFDGEGVANAVANAPTVDAVEVVRCKDCKHYFHYGKGVYGCRTFGMMKTKPDGFCSYGERREGE